MTAVDKPAFDASEVDRERPRLVAYAARSGSDDPENVVQQALEAWWKRIAATHLPAVDNHRAYLWTTVHNLALKDVARGRVEHVADVTELEQRLPLSDAEDPPPHIQAARAALENLPNDHKTALLMRHVDGDTTNAVAIALNVAPATARKRCERATKAFIAEFHAHLPEILKGLGGVLLAALAVPKALFNSARAHAATASVAAAGTVVAFTILPWLAPDPPAHANDLPAAIPANPAAVEPFAPEPGPAPMRGETPKWTGLPTVPATQQPEGDSAVIDNGEPVDAQPPAQLPIHQSHDVEPDGPNGPDASSQIHVDTTNEPAFVEIDYHRTGPVTDPVCQTTGATC